MTQKQRDELSKMLQELHIIRNPESCKPWRVEIAFERLERFIREKCGDKMGVANGLR